MQEELNTELMSMVLGWTEGQPLIPFLACFHCGEVFNQPMRLPCGHTLCKRCLPQDKRVCRECQVSYKPELVSKDLLANSIIEDLNLNCDYGDCKWSGAFAQYKKHLKRVHLMNPDLGESNSSLFNMKSLKVAATNGGEISEKKDQKETKAGGSGKPLKIAREQSSKALGGVRKSASMAAEKK
jgi:hypothetical protein